MTDDFCVLFGRRLAKIRKQKGIAQDALALKCDMARSYVGEVERGKRNISLRNICKLAIGLEVTVSELLSLVDDEICKL